MVLFGLVCAGLAYGTRDIVLQQVREPNPDLQPEARTGRSSLVFEWFPLLCAFLSILYWFAIKEQKAHRVVAKVVYHLAWSYLRPCYAITFLIYWTKKMHQFQWVQKSLCGFGCLNFSALATMAVTAMTIKANLVCKTGGASHHKTDYTADTLGRIGHSFESFGFYASMLFF